MPSFRLNYINADASLYELITILLFNILSLSTGSHIFAVCRAWPENYCNKNSVPLLLTSPNSLLVFNNKAMCPHLLLYPYALVHKTVPREVGQEKGDRNGSLGTIRGARGRTMASNKCLRKHLSNNLPFKIAHMIPRKFWT